ncbi:MAG: hypothetical protein BZY87_00080 [SAR202 cluster bacterium Io17-Chloro-G6]|nr:MAG: hypothetical protein BZY87_00080 [SAR202 cluster bacterium Io17-Chloro-G6]
MEHLAESLPLLGPPQKPCARRLGSSAPVVGRPSGVFLTCAAFEGDTVSRIIDEVGESPDSLIAMTNHGRSGPARWTMGSVTDRVVRHSGDPVLVVRTD